MIKVEYFWRGKRFTKELDYVHTRGVNIDSIPKDATFKPKAVIYRSNKLSGTMIIVTPSKVRDLFITSENILVPFFPRRRRRFVTEKSYFRDLIIPIKYLKPLFFKQVGSLIAIKIKQFDIILEEYRKVFNDCNYSREATFYMYDYTINLKGNFALYRVKTDSGFDERYAIVQGFNDSVDKTVVTIFHPFYKESHLVLYNKELLLLFRPTPLV